MDYYPAETQVTPLTNVRRERVLPAPGEILVRMGDQVEPMQIVAQANVPGNSHMLPVARLLNVTSSQVKRYLQVQIGERVERGQILARRGRLWGPKIHSPIDGWVVFSGGGRLLIEAEAALFELKAYIPGTVTNVVEPHGVVIETTGAVVQGVWGAGEEGLGVLKQMVERHDGVLHGRAIDPSCHGMILIGGAGLDAEAIEQAQTFKVRGIIVGSISPELIAQLEDVQFPVVVTEGIGDIPMSPPIFQLLATNNGREAALSGRVQPRWPTLRPEVIIPVPAERMSASSSRRSQPGTPLSVGDQVRVVRAPYIGAVGKVLALPEQVRQIETGARVHGAEVDLGQGEPVFVPLLNLEVLR
jgi:hypothetical protein